MSLSYRQEHEALNLERQFYAADPIVQDAFLLRVSPPSWLVSWGFAAICTAMLAIGFVIGSWP